MSEPFAYFTPPQMTTATPSGDPHSPHVTVGEHRFDGSFLKVTVPPDFRTDFASIPGSLVLRAVSAVSLLGMWLVVNVNSRVDWPEMLMLVALLWLHGVIAKFIDPRGRHQRAALFHDFAYRTQVDAYGRPIAREDADAMFRTIMRIDKVPRAQRESLYAAVRLCGWVAWGRNRRQLEKESGHA